MNNLSLYDVSIGTYLQLLPALSGILDLSANHSNEQGINPNSLLQEKLADDMWPLTQQLNSARHHSLGAIEGIERGLFQPPPSLPDMTFADFQQFITDTISTLQSIDEETVNALGDKELLFKAGEFQLSFTGANFLLSFSLPNFYFHVTTAYDILRKAGVPIGKLNYLGKLKANV